MVDINSLSPVSELTELDDEPGQSHGNNRKMLDSTYLFTRSYGRSLFASYLPHYVPDFVLLGCPKLDFIDALKSQLKDSVSVFHIL